MLATLLVVAGIAAADSLNPTTIGPALLFTVATKPARHVLEFAAGFFLVNLAGGILLVLGPGEWLLSLLPHPSAHTKHILEIAGGVALLAIAAGLWVGRRRLAKPGSERKINPRSGSAFVTGAGIALAELPTALPYFAAIAAIVAADLHTATELILLLVFNVIFVAPVFAIAIALGVAPSLRASFIEPLRTWLTVEWPKVAAVIVAAGGIALLAVGVGGLAGE